MHFKGWITAFVHVPEIYIDMLYWIGTQELKRQKAEQKVSTEAARKAEEESAVAEQRKLQQEFQKNSVFLYYFQVKLNKLKSFNPQAKKSQKL